jgi:hypothetical protein
MCLSPSRPRFLVTGDGDRSARSTRMPRDMDQRTLLDGLQIPVANVGAELSLGVLQTSAYEGGHGMFDDPGPESCDVHPGGRRAITRGSATYCAEAGAHQLVETGEHDVQSRQVHGRRRLSLAGWLAGRTRWRSVAPACRDWPAASQDAPRLPPRPARKSTAAVRLLHGDGRRKHTQANTHGFARSASHAPTSAQ